MIIEWESAPARIYRVERSADLAAGYLAVTSGVAATPPVNTLHDTTPLAPSCFYRVFPE